MVNFALHIPIDHIHPKGEFQSPSAIREMAAALEKAGLAACHVTDHPAPSSAWLHSDPSAHDALDPFTSLAFVAAATTRLKLFTNVVVLPYRNPFVTAKAAATLQVLSEGRVLLGIGAGYQAAECEALGAPYKQRGAMTDEALETIRMAWAGGAVTKKGRFFNADGVEARPVPEPTPPIWVGGGSDKAVERAARWGDGWIPYFILPTNDPVVKMSSVDSMEQLSEKMKRIQDIRAKLGRTGVFDLSVGPNPWRPEAATKAAADKFNDISHQLVERGATWIWTRVPFPSRAGYLENVAWFGEEIVARFQRK